MDTIAPESVVPINREEFFAGAGEMAALMRAHDWTQTPLGSPHLWPQSLKTIVRILLTSRYAMWMAWGDELTFFCNDAYKPTLGVKGSWALGASAQKVWEEIWPDIGPRIGKVLHTGEATWDAGLLLFLERSGYPEETYHTFSYSPLADDGGTVSGMLCVVTEETERIIGERRLALLREVAAALASAQTVDDVFAAVAGCIEANARDLPFTLAYMFNEDARTARLVSTTGIPVGATIAVPVIGQNDGDTPFPLRSLLTETEPVLLDNLPARFDNLPTGRWDKPPRQAILFPIAQQGQERSAGFLVAALNPYRKFDTEYREFIGLLVGQIASSLANAHAYEEERKRSEALAALDLAKTTFFSNVSHEFRTPLTLMLGPVEDVLAAPEEELSAQRRDLLTIAHRNGLRLLKLVNTLLDFTRIEAGKVQAHYEPTDLSAYTAELASLFRSAVEKAGMQLNVECLPLSEPAFIDREMWEKIVLNLLSNAFKFTLEGEITITIREDNGHAIVAVRDTGTGITEDQITHIFERFHRVEGTRARTHEGTGIGLALVQELVKQHGGEVVVASIFGVGTTFTVKLPLGSAHLPKERITAAKNPSTALRAEVYVEETLRWLPNDGEAASDTLGSTNGVAYPANRTLKKQRPHILLADDNADMREYVQRLLHPHYKVTVVANGSEALRAAQAARPDLVLSDVMMPELDGFGLLRSLRSDPYTASIPVILLSARAGEAAQIEGLSAGADDYLTKPFSARELLARVASHLELSFVRREAEQAVRASEERMRHLADAMPQLVWTASSDGSVDYYNSRIVEYGGTEQLGTWNWLTMLHQDERAPTQEAWNAAVAAEASFEYVHRVQMRDGSFRWHLSRAIPMRADNGALKWFGTATDIDAQKQAEEALRNNQQEIETMNVRLQRAMTETHHRVKNNLQLISALIDMQRNTTQDVVSVEEFTRLSANVRALSVIHDILTQEAKSGGDQETLSAKAILERLIAGLEKTTGGRRLIASVEEARIVGRQATTLALITNELISNALKHGKGDTEISLRVEADRLWLDVSDDGPGFPTDFDPDTAANTGLELVHNIVQWDLRGQITYGNHPEGGAQVTVTFPTLLHK